MTISSSCSLASRSHRIMLAAWLGLAISGTAYADEAAIERGKAATAVCVACHQADGNGMQTPASAWPRLAGLDADYLAHQLHAFKDGERKNAEMMPFAQMLNDDQINDVAAYYASLPPKIPQQTKDSPQATPEELARGEELALHGDWDRYIVPCIKCHGVGNQGVGHLFPGIAGQHAGYLAHQLQAWHEGNRLSDPNGVMLAVAARLSDDDVHAVAAWLATQPPAPDTTGGVSEKENGGKQ